MIEHVSGGDNIFADMLTRWCRGHHPESRIANCISTVSSISLVAGSSELQWPSINHLKSAQQKSINRPEGPDMDRDGIWKKNGRIWVPDSSPELQLKVLLGSNCGIIGHRRAGATESISGESFWWPNLKESVRQSLKTCLHCMVSRSGKLIPRPLGTVSHRSRPNELLHMDYLYSESGGNGNK